MNDPFKTSILLNPQEHKEKAESAIEIENYYNTLPANSRASTIHALLMSVNPLTLGQLLSHDISFKALVNRQLQAREGQDEKKILGLLNDFVTTFEQPVENMQPSALEERNKKLGAISEEIRDLA